MKSYKLDKMDEMDEVGDFLTCSDELYITTKAED